MTTDAYAEVQDNLEALRPQTPRVAGGPPPFAALNRLLEPLVRYGVGAPLPLPLGWSSGLVVLEVAGRRSGRIYRVPLLAGNSGDLVLITTLRDNSQWLRNLAAAREVVVWLRGRPRFGTPWVWEQSDTLLPDGEKAARTAARLQPWLQTLGLHGALIDLID